MNKERYARTKMFRAAFDRAMHWARHYGLHTGSGIIWKMAAMRVRRAAMREGLHI